MSHDTKPAWTPFERVGEITANPNTALPDGTIYRNCRYQEVVRHPVPHSCGFRSSVSTTDPVAISSV